METVLSTADLCDRFLDDPAGAHALQVVRLPAPGLRPYGGRAAYHGRIVTLAPVTPGDAVRLRDVLSQAGNDCVLVVDNHADDRWAVLGDQLAALGQQNGWAGIVLNGYVRDVRMLASIDIGIHALGAVPARPRAFGASHGGQAVAFGRARIAPGGWLYADEDGIVVCPERQHPAP